MQQPTDYLARGAQKTLVGKAAEVPNPGGGVDHTSGICSAKKLPHARPTGRGVRAAAVADTSTLADVAIH